MDTSGVTPEHLIALCQTGDREQLLSELREPSAAQRALDSEDVLVDPDLGTRTKQLTLERMLVAAAKGGHAETVESLLSFGQQHNVASQDLLTPTIIASGLYENSLQVMLKFQAVDSDVFTRSLPGGGNIFANACHGGPNSEPIPRKKHLDLVRHLMKEGFDPNAAFPLQRRDSGFLLYVASWQACREIVECLLGHGAVIVGSRATRVAARKGRIDNLEALLRHGADLNEPYPAKDSHGPPGTPLHVAVASGQVSIVEWLLQHGADPTLRSSDGKTAEELALEGGDGALTGLLRRD